MGLSDEEIGRLYNHEQYWRLSGQRAEAEAQMELMVLGRTPRNSLPLSTIRDYEKVLKGQPVTSEPPLRVPLIPGQRTDNRVLGQYIQTEQQCDDAQNKQAVESLIATGEGPDDSIQDYLRCYGAEMLIYYP